MKKLYIISLFLIFSTVIINAQKNFKEGYIITNQGDTIRGLIDLKSDASNAQVCYFKTNEEATSQSYYPKDIASYRFDKEGKYYVSKEITIEKEDRLVFLEYLVQGTMDLYFYKEPSRYKLDYYMFVNPSGETTVISKKQNQFDGKRDYVDDNYKNMLTYIFREYPEMMNLVRNESEREFVPTKLTTSSSNNTISYNRESMINLVKNYHEKSCTTGEDCIVFENPYSKKYLKVEFMPYIGIQYIEQEWAKTGLINSKYLSPKIGAQLHLSLPRSIPAFLLFADVSLAQFKSKHGIPFSDAIYYHFKYSTLIINGSLGIQYTYPKGNIRPFAQVGYGLSFFTSKSTKTSFEEEDQDKQGFYEKYTSDFHTTENTMSGWLAGAGVNIMLPKKHAIVAQFSYENGKNKEKLTSMIFKLGYKF